MIRVVAIDDHPIILKAITQDLEKCQDMQLVGTADHGSKLFDLVAKKSPHVVILDLKMVGGVFEPVSAVQELHKMYPSVQILILTGDDNPIYMHNLTRAGARGYVLKSDNLSSELPEAVRKLSAGERHYSSAVMEILLSDESEQMLNSRELEVLCLAAEGLQSNEIGKRLKIKEKHVRNILSSIYCKMGIQERKEGINARVMMINMARERNLLN